MTTQDLNQLTAQVDRLRALVERQEARIEALTDATPSPSGSAPTSSTPAQPVPADLTDPADPASPTRRLLFGHALAASLGALLVRPARAQNPSWNPAGTHAPIGAGHPLQGYTGIGNTALGHLAGKGLNPDHTAGNQGRWNTAIGVEAMMMALDGSAGLGNAQRTTGVGRGALRDMTGGFYNDGFGADAGRHCNLSNRNTFLGNNAGKWVGSIDPQADAHPTWSGDGVTDPELEGSRNVMIGRNSGHFGVLAQSCVAVGYNAGAHWGSNYGVTVVGRNSLLANPTASRTVGMGAFAMSNSAVGAGDSVAIGYEALKYAAGNNNVAIGAFAGRDNTGGQNIFIGEQAGIHNVAGYDNVIIGRHAGRDTDGFRNIFIGRMAGLGHSGRDNTLIIHNTSSSAPFLEGSMGESSQWWLKTRGDVLPHADGAWSVGSPILRWKEVWAMDGTINTSDARLKEAVAEEDLGLEFVESLRPVVWKWKDRPGGDDHRGLLAQDVQRAAEKCGSARGFSAVVDRGGALGLREREFLGPLIKAVQELSERVRGLEGAHATGAR